MFVMFISSVESLSKRAVTKHGLPSVQLSLTMMNLKKDANNKCLGTIWSTVSHFSYAPLFQGPYFLKKMLESNILYDNLLIDILSVC